MEGVAASAAQAIERSLGQYHQQATFTTAASSSFSSSSTTSFASPSSSSSSSSSTSSSSSSSVSAGASATKPSLPQIHPLCTSTITSKFPSSSISFVFSNSNLSTNTPTSTSTNNTSPLSYTPPHFSLPTSTLPLSSLSSLLLPPLAHTPSLSPAMEGLLTNNSYFPTTPASTHDQIIWQNFMNLPGSYQDKKPLLPPPTANSVEPQNSLPLSSSLPLSHTSLNDSDFSSTGQLMSFSQCLQEGMNMDASDYSNLFMRQLGGETSLLLQEDDQRSHELLDYDDPLPSLSSALSSASFSQSFGYTEAPSPSVSSYDHFHAPAGKPLVRSGSQLHSQLPMQVYTSSIAADSKMDGSLSGQESHGAAGMIGSQPPRIQQLPLCAPKQAFLSRVTAVSPNDNQSAQEDQTIGMVRRAGDMSTFPGTPISSLSNSLSSDGGGLQDEEETQGEGAAAMAMRSSQVTVKGEPETGAEDEFVSIKPDIHTSTEKKP